MKDETNVSNDERIEETEIWSHKYCTHCHKKFYYSNKMIIQTIDSVYGRICSVRCEYCGKMNSIH